MVSKSPDAFRTISEVAEDLDLPQHVLRFWETRFPQIKPMKRGGGRRYYRPDDIDLLRGIRWLLYSEGYTIKGVQRILREQGPRFVVAAGRGEISGAMVAQQAAPDDFDAETSIPDSPESEMAMADDDDEGPAPTPRIDRSDYAPAPRQRRFVDRLTGTRDPAPVSANLGSDDVQLLQGTLAELLDCKRLLDQVR